jgi:ApbE superfamily uncharacterized protein (UPF0280 family)
MTQIRLLPNGRLHLQHGPIDCLVQAWGEAYEIESAYTQAAAAFPTILPNLCSENPLLRHPLPSPEPFGHVARAMHQAVQPFAAGFITPMAAVAGAVADHILATLLEGRTLTRAVVNNGGDIALHLAPGQSLRCGLVSDLAHPTLDAAFSLTANQAARGIATSGRACKGRFGRSFSRGIADSVTVLARTAAQADAAATVIANAVNLPGHPAIIRRPAHDIDPDNDLGALSVTWDLGPLFEAEIAAALDAGAVVADDLVQAGLILGAILCLRGQKIIRHEAWVRALELA